MPGNGRRYPVYRQYQAVAELILDPAGSERKEEKKE